jgi:hypothetical protein
VGQLEDANGQYLISVGTDYLRTYSIGLDGVVGKQASEINTQDYSGSKCGNTGFAAVGSNAQANGSVLDRTGKFLYAQLWDATYNYEGEQYFLCAAWQSYKIGPNGDLTFLGDIVYDSEYHGNAIGSSVPTISGNDSFSAFKRDSSGLLEVNTSFSEVDPTPRPEDGPFYPIIMAADANGHLAVLMLEWFAGTIPPPQLASYTVTTQPAP